jgi:uncharacterized protein (TIGR03083 family)
MDENPFDLLEIEARRIDRFYSALDAPQWSAPTRCTGWSRKDLLAHLVTVEDYTHSCLESSVGDFFGQAESAGYERLNDILVQRRTGDSGAELFEEWRTKVGRNHRRLRERGEQDMLETSVGPYPLGRQAWYLACELAIHADDAGVPVTGEEREFRLDWRARFGIDALGESRPEARVEVSGQHADGQYLVLLKDEHAGLSKAEFVEATSGRLPAGHPIPAQLRSALKVLA